MTIKFPPPRSSSAPTKPIPRCPPREPVKPGVNVFNPHKPPQGPHRHPPIRWPNPGDRFDR